MELEEAIKNVEFLIRDLKADNYNPTFIKAIETVLQALEDKTKKISKINNKLQEILDKNYKLYHTKGKKKEVDFSEWNLADELQELLEDK